MADKIFLVQRDKLVAMERSKYHLEDKLQELLAMYPDLMPGEQLDPDQPRRWLLVSREFGIPDSLIAIDRWSIDHLFLDQDGVPTLVEAKRSTDPRIRREVVGQLIEYAANAQSFWNVQGIRDALALASEQSEAEMLTQTLGVIDAEEFWQKVKSNLQAGRLRLIFVADEIPQDLKRMIEFLNVQMDPAEVFGIELPQFLGSDLQTIVPRLVGNTSQAAERKQASSRLKRKWDEESFFSDMKKYRPLDEVVAVRELYTWLQTIPFRIWWGEGATEGSFVASIDVEEVSYNIIRFSSQGWNSLYIDWFGSYPAFVGRDIRAELINRLNDEAGANVDLAAKRPTISPEVLASLERLVGFKSILMSLADEIRAFHRKSGG